MRNQAKNEGVVIQLHPPLPQSMSDDQIQDILDEASRQIFLYELVNDDVAGAIYDLLSVFDNRQDFIAELIDDLYMFTMSHKDADAFDKNQRENYFLVYQRLQKIVRAATVKQLKRPF